MTETGWQAIGRIAKSRRERLGLKQDQLGMFGGPAVATVGKFERAAQSSFPLRTQHQMEKALGWTRTTIEQVVGSIDDGSLKAEDWEYDLIEENIPDMSQAPAPREGGEADRDLLDEFEDVYQELVRATARAAGMEAQLKILGAHLDARTEAMIEAIDDDEARTRVRRAVSGLADAYAVKVADGSVDPLVRFSTPLVLYVTAQNEIQRLTGGGDGHADESAGGAASITPAGVQIDTGSGRPRAGQPLEVDE